MGVNGVTEGVDRDVRTRCQVLFARSSIDSGEMRRGITHRFDSLRLAEGTANCIVALNLNPDSREGINNLTEDSSSGDFIAGALASGFICLKIVPREDSAVGITQIVKGTIPKDENVLPIKGMITFDMKAEGELLVSFVLGDGGEKKIRFGIRQKLNAAPPPLVPPRVPSGATVARVVVSTSAAAKLASGNGTQETTARAPVAGVEGDGDMPGEEATLVFGENGTATHEFRNGEKFDFALALSLGSMHLHIKRLDAGAIEGDDTRTFGLPNQGGSRIIVIEGGSRLKITNIEQKNGVCKIKLKLLPLLQDK